MQLHDLNQWPTRLPCIRQIDSSDGESMCIAIAQASSRDQIAFNPDFFPGLLCTKITQVSHLIAKISHSIDGLESYMFYFQRKKNIKKEVIWATFLLTSVINRENKSSTSSFAELGVPAILKFEPVLLKKKTRAQVLFCFVRKKVHERLAPVCDRARLVAHVEVHKTCSGVQERIVGAYCFFMCFLFTFY